MSMTAEWLIFAGTIVTAIASVIAVLMMIAIGQTLQTVINWG